MKQFGMQFTDPDGNGGVEHRKAARERQFFVYHDPQSHKDTRFQKGLAYWSYYTLVFTTFCTLTPELVKDTAITMVNLIA